MAMSTEPWASSFRVLLSRRVLLRLLLVEVAADVAERWKANTTSLDGTDHLVPNVGGPGASTFDLGSCCPRVPVRRPVRLQPPSLYLYPYLHRHLLRHLKSSLLNARSRRCRRSTSERHLSLRRCLRGTSSGLSKAAWASLLTHRHRLRLV